MGNILHSSWNPELISISVITSSARYFTYTPFTVSKYSYNRLSESLPNEHVFSIFSSIFPLIISSSA